MSFSRKSAFTLFELLVTMAVISIVVGAGFYTIARSTKDRALDKGVDTLHAMIRIARTQAIMNGAHARLIINADPTDTESYLRQVGVMIEDTTTNGNWIAVERGTYLPEGVFVVPQGEVVTFPVGWPSSGRRSVYKKTSFDLDDSAVYHFDYPLKETVSEISEEDPAWICIQFAPNGRLSSCTWGGGGAVPDSNQLVVASGNWNNGKVIIRDASEYVGIAFKASGSSYKSRETELIDDE